MKGKILIVPGYKGSPAGHWQTWLEGHYPNSDRLKSVNVNQPILSTWSEEIERYLVQQNEPVTLVAHSFGCLAAAHVIAKHKRQVNAALLVAPASPHRFTEQGHITHYPTSPSISDSLPSSPLGVTGLIMASQNDPWLAYPDAHELAVRWGVRFHNAGYVGHINIESGHGPYPKIKSLLDNLIATTETTATK